MRLLATEMRKRLSLVLRGFIDRIEVFPVGHDQVYDLDKQPQHKLERRPAQACGQGYMVAPAAAKPKPVGDTFVEEMHATLDELDLRYDAEVIAFLDNVLKRRMSKEGRFVRVHFKTGAIIDLVPPDSLASGMELVRDGRRKSGWRFVSPDLESLWSRRGLLRNRMQRFEYPAETEDIPVKVR